VPLRVNLLPRASAPAVPVATPRNDTATALALPASAIALPVATPRHDAATDSTTSVYNKMSTNCLSTRKAICLL
jgi:hypothetical protein